MRPAELLTEQVPIFTTLAAVAMDNMMLGFEKSGGLLPPNIGALIIDEAHEFEPTQANLAAHTLSLSNLRAALKRLEGHRMRPVIPS